MDYFNDVKYYNGKIEKKKLTERKINIYLTGTI
jgi:hypothetical protein